MNNSIKNLANKKVVLFLVQVFAFYRMAINCLYSTEQYYQVPKDLAFFYAAFWPVLLVALLRKRFFLKKEVWITLCIGVAIMGVYFKTEAINPERYGVDYFRVIHYSWLMCIVFLVFMVEFALSGTVRETLRKNRRVLVAFSVCSIPVILFHHTWIIALLCPVFMLLTTQIDKNRWLSLTNSLAIGYYLAFVQVMTQSLIENPDRYQDDTNLRWLGSFLQLESASSFCAGAAVCMFYFVGLYIWDENKKWYKIVIPLLLSVYPLYAVMRLTTRNAQLALIVMGFFAFIFVHKKKGKETTLKRLLIAGAMGIWAVGSLYAWSAYINRKCEASGDKYTMTYMEYRVSSLTQKADSDAYYKDSPFLNAVDLFSSGRLSIWVESAKQIKLTGHDFEEFTFDGEGEFVKSPHNVYIVWLINYGAVGGCLVISWMLYIGFCAIKGVINQERQVLLLFLWFVFCMTIYMNSHAAGWKSPISFVLLIMQYGIVMKEDDKLIDNQAARQ